MAQYLIDTDVCIFLLKNKHGIKEKINRVGIENCFISEITVAELIFGAFKSNKYDKHINEIADIEKLFTAIPIYDCFTLFGKKSRLNKIGKRLPDFDLLIGTTAVQKEMIMVTNNEKHLSRIEGIKLENWTK